MLAEVSGHHQYSVCTDGGFRFFACAFVSLVPKTGKGECQLSTSLTVLCEALKSFKDWDFISKYL